mgnify:CR=1 FL=1
MTMIEEVVSYTLKRRSVLVGNSREGESVMGNRTSRVEAKSSLKNSVMKETPRL